MRKLLIFVLFIFMSEMVYSQNTLRPNIYFNQMNYYNIAGDIGDSTVGHLLSYYTKDKIIANDSWTKPMTTMLSYMERLNGKPVTYSSAYIYDSYSYFDRHTFYAGYSYARKFGDLHHLSAGIRAVLNFDRIKWDQLELSNRTGSGLRFTPDLDLGIQYQLKGLTAGLASKNLFAASAEYDGEQLIENQREVYANLSYNFRIRQKFRLAPYLMYHQGMKSDIDLGLNLSYKNTFDISYQLRVLELRSIYIAKAKMYKGFYIGASFDSSILYQDNNIDVMLAYKF